MGPALDKRVEVVKEALGVGSVGGGGRDDGGHRVAPVGRMRAEGREVVEVAEQLLYVRVARARGRGHARGHRKNRDFQEGCAGRVERWSGGAVERPKAVRRCTRASHRRQCDDSRDNEPHWRCARTRGHGRRAALSERAQLTSARGLGAAHHLARVPRCSRRAGRPPPRTHRSPAPAMASTESEPEPVHGADISAGPTSSPSPTPSAPSARPRLLFHLVVLFVTLSSFSYGYGISELNALQGALTCYGVRGASRDDGGLLDCIPLSDTQFGLITALFTVGGFLGSLALPTVQRRFGLGLRGALVVALSLNALGNAFISVAHSGAAAGFGRLVTGLGSGMSLVAVPVYLNDISPPAIKGSIGVLNQLGVVFGIFVAQSAGVALASESTKKNGKSNSAWRFVPLISACVSVGQLLWGLLVAVDGPNSIEHSGIPNARHLAHKVRQRLWTFVPQVPLDAGSETAYVDSTPYPEPEVTPGEHPEREALLPSPSSSSAGPAGLDDLPDPITVKDLFTNSRLSPGMWMIVITQVGQQLGGVNAVLYFSTGIMSAFFEGGENADEIARTISVGITVVNALMTFPPIFLVSEKRCGRKKLLLFSSAVTVLSSFVLGLCLETGLSNILAAACIIIFVMGFAVGLGPVPFLILPELVPPHAAALAGSVGLSINWLSNIILASSFLPLRNLLGLLDGSKGGLVFWIFTIINATTFHLVNKYYFYKSDE